MYYHKSTVFPRVSFPQTGWMGKVPLGLLEVFDFVAPVRQLRDSFMVAESLHLDVRYQSVFSFDWISAALGGRKRPIAPWVKRIRLVKAHKRV